MPETKEKKQERVALPLFGIPRLLPFTRPYRKQFAGLVLAQVLRPLLASLVPQAQQALPLHLALVA